MSATDPRLVLAIKDPGLRSHLVARLGMAGENPISAVDHLDPTLREPIRATGLLIIDEVMIGVPSAEWVETLRNQCWAGWIVIITDNVAALAEAHDTVALVGRRDAAVTIPELVHLWQERSGRLTGSE